MSKKEGKQNAQAKKQQEANQETDVKRPSQATGQSEGKKKEGSKKKVEVNKKEDEENKSRTPAQRFRLQSQQELTQLEQEDPNQRYVLEITSKIPTIQNLRFESIFGKRAYEFMRHFEEYCDQDKDYYKKHEELLNLMHSLITLGLTEFYFRYEASVKKGKRWLEYPNKVTFKEKVTKRRYFFPRLHYPFSGISKDLLQENECPRNAAQLRVCVLFKLAKKNPISDTFLSTLFGLDDSSTHEQRQINPMDELYHTKGLITRMVCATISIFYYSLGMNRFEAKPEIELSFNKDLGTAYMTVDCNLIPAQMIIDQLILLIENVLQNFFSYTKADNKVKAANRVVILSFRTGREQSMGRVTPSNELAETIASQDPSSLKSVCDNYWVVLERLNGQHQFYTKDIENFKSISRNAIMIPDNLIAPTKRSVTEFYHVFQKSVKYVPPKINSQKENSEIYVEDDEDIEDDDQIDDQVNDDAKGNEEEDDAIDNADGNDVEEASDAKDKPQNPINAESNDAKDKPQEINVESNDAKVNARDKCSPKKTFDMGMKGKFASKQKKDTEQKVVISMVGGKRKASSIDGPTESSIAAQSPIKKRDLKKQASTTISPSQIDKGAQSKAIAEDDEEIEDDQNVDMDECIDISNEPSKQMLHNRATDSLYGIANDSSIHPQTPGIQDASDETMQQKTTTNFHVQYHDEHNFILSKKDDSKKDSFNCPDEDFNNDEGDQEADDQSPNEIQINLKYYEASKNYYDVFAKIYQRFGTSILASLSKDCLMMILFAQINEDFDLQTLQHYSNNHDPPEEAAGVNWYKKDYPANYKGSPLDMFKKILKIDNRGFTRFQDDMAHLMQIGQECDACRQALKSNQESIVSKHNAQQKEQNSKSSQVSILSKVNLTQVNSQPNETPSEGKSSKVKTSQMMQSSQVAQSNHQVVQSSSHMQTPMHQYLKPLNTLQTEIANDSPRANNSEQPKSSITDGGPLQRSLMKLKLLPGNPTTLPIKRTIPTTRDRQESSSSQNVNQQTTNPQQKKGKALTQHAKNFNPSLQNDKMNQCQGSQSNRNSSDSQAMEQNQIPPQVKRSKKAKK